MTTNGTRLASITLAASLSLAVGQAAGRDDRAVVWCIADGKGAVDLFWTPLDAWPPGGFRVERLSASRTETVVDRLRPLGNTEAVSALSAELRAEADRIAEGLARGGDAGKHALGQAFLRGAIVPELGRALGLRVTDKDGAGGTRRYRVSGLGPKAEALWRVETESIDPARVTEAPRAPGDLTATIEGTAVRLRWTTPRREGIPPLAFTVERRSGSETRALTGGPTVPGRVKGQAQDGFRDKAPPPGAEATYVLTLYDLFGRPSPSAEATIRFPDLSLLAPSGLTARAEPGRIVVSWRPVAKAGTSGYWLERARLESGPYARMAGKPLPPQTARYVDEDVVGEAVYYYRLRSVAENGDASEPSATASAEAVAKAPPVPPRGLAAEVGRTRVRLTWKPAPGPLSGYLVERQTASGRWARLNPDYSAEPRFDDELGPQEAALLSYRVTTISHAGKRSLPSAALSVRLRDTVPPPVPRLVAVRQDAAGVHLDFLPGAPAEATAAFRILRSEKRNEPGLVLGPALPGSARSFEDSCARPGRQYFYRAFSVDEAGNRSSPSEPLRAVVTRPAVPAAAPPRLEARMKPFPHVRVRSAAPPPGLSIVIERRVAGEPSFVVVGTLAEAADGFVDASPPAGEEASYRVAYRDAAGGRGAASAAVAISVPRP